MAGLRFSYLYICCLSVYRKSIQANLLCAPVFFIAPGVAPFGDLLVVAGNEGLPRHVHAAILAGFVMRRRAGRSSERIAKWADSLSPIAPGRSRTSASVVPPAPEASAGQHVVADRDFARHQRLPHPLVDPFITMSAQEDQVPAIESRLAVQLVVKTATVGVRKITIPSYPRSAFRVSIHPRKHRPVEAIIPRRRHTANHHPPVL